ncbi:MAG: nucleotidyltransferase family protein [Nanoarchaeota archaeon]
MKCVILCAGYGTRLYPLTKFIAKPLLPLNGKPVINYIIEKVDELKDVDEIFITTNKEFHEQFNEWKEAYKDFFKQKITLFKNTYFFKKKKMGGVDAISRIVKKYKVKDDFLVIGGDNLFDFSLKPSYKFFRKKKSTIILLHKLKNKKKASSFGIVQTRKGVVVDFQEKPEKPNSNLISTAVYFFPRKDLDLITHYNNSQHKGDSFGHFLKFLYQKEKVYGFAAKGIFIDIGNLDDYRRAGEVLG